MGGQEAVSFLPRIAAAARRWCRWARRPPRGTVSCALARRPAAGLSVRTACGTASPHSRIISTRYAHAATHQRVGPLALRRGRKVLKAQQGEGVRASEDAAPSVRHWPSRCAHAPVAPSAGRGRRRRARPAAADARDGAAKHGWLQAEGDPVVAAGPKAVGCCMLTCLSQFFWNS